MGLDSVELVMEWEEFFDIEIPDEEAEKMGTIQEAVDSISLLVTFKKGKTDIREEIFKKVAIALNELGALHSPLTGDQKVFDILALSDKDLWTEVSQKINYRLPSPSLGGTFDKVSEFLLPHGLDLKETNVDRYVDLICAVNYLEILDRKNIQNKYEILVAVMGMTIKMIGVHPHEVFANSSFVHDLGID